MQTPIPHFTERLVVLTYVNPLKHTHTPLQCLFIYANLSQRVPAVIHLSVSFRFLKPMIFNTSAQWRIGQTPHWLEVCVCCKFPRADWELRWPEEMHQFHL